MLAVKYTGANVITITNLLHVKRSVHPDVTEGADCCTIEFKCDARTEVFAYLLKEL